MEITTGFYTADLFNGWVEDDAAIYDERESAEQYANLCQAAIEETYPDATVEIHYQSGATGELPRRLQTHVNGFSAAEASPQEMHVIETVEHIVGQIYADYKWCVIRDELITLAEASDLFNIPPSTLRYHAAREHFPAMKKAKTWLINVRDLHKWVGEKMGGWKAWRAASRTEKEERPDWL